MEIQDTTAAIYSEAKSEYTRQLVGNFQPVLLRFFLDRLDEARKTKTSKSTLAEFQESLSQIPEWNLDKVQKETAGLLNSVSCDYIEDLITAVFIAHTKILSAIRLHAKPRRRIQITVPKPDHFMHRTLSECSRLLWSNIYLFSETAPALERQKNMNEVGRFLEEGILQAVRNLLPVKSILRESLQEDDDDGVEISNTPIKEDAKDDFATGGGLDLSGTTLDLSGSSLLQDTAHSVSVPSVKIPELPAPVATGQITQDISGVVLPPTNGPIVEKLPGLPLAAQANQTFVVDTEKSVDFTGMDTVFGAEGQAEVRPMIEENQEEEFDVSDTAENLNMDDFEDLDNPIGSSTPLGADDYETL
jgi:hypothetical protein